MEHEWMVSLGVFDRRLNQEALLVEQWDKLEQAYIEDWLTQFAEVLRKPEILTEYQRILTKIKSVD